MLRSAKQNINKTEKQSQIKAKAKLKAKLKANLHAKPSKATPGTCYGRQSKTTETKLENKAKTRLNHR